MEKELFLGDEIRSLNICYDNDQVCVIYVLLVFVVVKNDM